MLVMAVCVSTCLSVSGRIPTLMHGPGCNLGNGRGCPLVVHYWADLQSVHGFRCYDNIAPNTKCQPVFVLALCLVEFFIYMLMQRVLPTQLLSAVPCYLVSFSLCFYLATPTQRICVCFKGICVCPK